MKLIRNSFVLMVCLVKVGPMGAMAEPQAESKTQASARKNLVDAI